MKKLLCVLVSIVLSLGIATACGNAPAPAAPAAPAAAQPADAPAADQPADAPAPAAGEAWDIGVVFYDLANPVWATGAAHLVEYAYNMFGASVTVLGSEGSASLQVSQMETLIEAGVDAIIVGAVDDAALTSVISRARAEDIVVLAWGTEPEGAHAYFSVENYEVGFEAGRQAAIWINEVLGGTADVAVLRFDEMEVLVDRGNGIEDAIAQHAPGATIVAVGHSADPVSGMSVTEALLTEHPTIQVIVCIGDGGAIGANNAVRAAGMADDYFGIFSVDGTEQAVRSIVAGDPIRMSILLGTESERVSSVLTELGNILRGEPFKEWIFTPVVPVTIDNAEEIIRVSGW